MTRRLGHLLIVVALGAFVVGAVGTPRSVAAEVWTFADHFDNRSYNTNDGTHPFEGPWSEGPIHNGANRGNISIAKSACSSGCLSIGDPVAVADSRISRTISIDGATSARLAFTHRTAGSPQETAMVVVSVHDGSRSRDLATFPLSADGVGMRSASYDITSHAGPATTIRFRIVGVGTTDSVLLVDDLVVTATFDEEPTTTTTTRTIPTIPTTTSTTTTSTTTTTTTTTTPSTTTTTSIAPTTTTTTPGTTASTSTTTTTRPTTATTISGGAASSTTTTTIIIPPTQDPDFATDKAVLVSSSEDAAMAVMQPLESMSPNSPQSIRTVTFVTAAESVRSTAVYGVGVGALLAGFLLLGFDDGATEGRRRKRG